MNINIPTYPVELCVTITDPMLSIHNRPIFGGVNFCYVYDRFSARGGCGYGLEILKTLNLN